MRDISVTDTQLHIMNFNVRDCFKKKMFVRLFKCRIVRCCFSFCYEILPYHRFRMPLHQQMNEKFRIQFKLVWLTFEFFLISLNFFSLENLYK